MSEIQRNGRYKRFVAIDGESYTEGDDHRYVLMAASSKDYIYNEKGIPTLDCFEWLLSLRHEHKAWIFVAFGLNYDVNMMLRDLPKRKLQELWKTRKTLFQYKYIIEWIPGKWFGVRRKGEKGIRIYDVFGFFQKSFVAACASWEIELPAEIETMKGQRSVFDSAMKDQIIEYCIAECEALAALMRKLNKALISVNLRPNSWVGAGSIASSLLTREGVRNHICHDFEWEPEVVDAILRAYFGGRVELFQQGPFPRLYDYDVQSAYPFVALSLPDLNGATWTQASSYDRTARYAVWHVSWDIDPRRILMPFPVRYKRNIYYPSRGEGYYHAAEVKKATDLYPDGIQVHDGFVLTPGSGKYPFSFVRNEFEYRADLKAQGHPGEKVLKFALAALYGKCAQGVGYQGKLPTFQSFFWAGYMTAGTRAKLLDVGGLAPDKLVMMATDGVFFSEPADIVLSEGLGGWELSVAEDAFVAHPGVYSAIFDGERVSRSRGFFARELDFEALAEGYVTDGPYHISEYDSRRFVGLGSALMLKDFGHWRTWKDGKRQLQFYPNRKWIDHSLPLDTSQPIRHWPGSGTGILSEQYVPKDGDMEWAKDVTDHIQGTEQPLREY